MRTAFTPRHAAIAVSLLAALAAVPAHAAEPVVPPAAPTTRPAAPATQPAAAVDEAAEKKKAAEAEAAKKKAAVENFLRSQRQQRDNVHNNYSGLKLAGTYTLDSLLNFSVVDGQIQVECNAMPTTERTRVAVEGSNAIWVVTRHGMQAWNVNQNFPSTTSIARYEPDVKDDKAIWQTSITVSARSLSISGQWVGGRVSLSQVNNGVTANVMEYAANPNGAGIRVNNILTVRKASLQELRAAHPIEFRQHILPLLAKVSDLKWLQPGAADVYSAFGTIAADQKIIQRIEGLLPELDADAFPIRDAASQQLAELGPAGVLAALRMDLSKLTGEQSGRLREFVASHRRRTLMQPQDAARDPEFLVDCLEHDDPQVRGAAHRALEALTGQKLTFNASLKGAELAKAADAARQKVTELLPPATQPAEAEAQPAAVQQGAVQIQIGPAQQRIMVK